MPRLTTSVRLALAAALAAGATVVIGVERPLAQVATPPAPTGEASNMSLVGRSDLGGGGLNGPLDVIGTTAIVGAGVVADPGSTHTERFNPFNCETVSVKIVDLADPTRPKVVSTIPLAPGVAAVDIAAIRVSTPTFTGDLAAIALDDGPSHTAPTRCNPSQATTHRGVAYYDVTDPARPALLGRYLADFDRIQPGALPCGVPPAGAPTSCANGQHSVSIAQRPDGRVISVSTEPVASLLVYDSADVRVPAPRAAAASGRARPRWPSPATPRPPSTGSS